MKVEKYVVGIIGTNCYLIINEDTKETVIVDPGGYPEELKREIKEKGLDIQAVILTHAHFDHIMGPNDVMKDYPVPVYIEEHDKEMLTDDNANLSGGYMNGGFKFTDVKTVADGQVLELAGFRFQVIHTPGHTPGGCCYYVEEEGVLFSGDTLFQASVGRTDFPGGSASDLVRSIKEKLLILPEETHVYPGHMEETTIGYEKLYNPFV